MIVEADFLDHWKTQMLATTLNDPLAPCYLIRLWAHCQQRKEYCFEAAKLTPAILKAITRSTADQQALWDAFMEVGFLDLHADGTIEAHGFFDANSQLCVNWANGKKGGRPKKKITPEKPSQNPSETHPEPKEERERAEEKEEAEKQDEGEKEDEPSISPPPGKKPFWYGTDYSTVKHRMIEDYADLHAMNDPIEAAMVVCGDYSSGMYGFLVKGCKKCLLAGLHTDSIRIFLFQEIEKIFGEIKAGERKRKGDAIPTFVARMREHFETIDQPKIKAA